MKKQLEVLIYLTLINSEGNHPFLCLRVRGHSDTMFISPVLLKDKEYIKAL